MTGPRFVRLDGISRLATGVVVLQFLMLAVLHPILRPYSYSDFATFHAAARCFATGGNPYDVAALRAARAPEWQGWTGRYFYPPPFAACALRPAAALPFDVARRLWAGVEALAYAGAAALLLRVVLPHAGRAGAVLAATLAASFAPMAFDLHLGSVSGILLLLVTAALAFRSRGHEWRAAFCLAAAVLLKLVPAVLLAVWVLRREWRLAGKTCVAGLGLLVAALPWTGVTAYVWYRRDALPALGRETFTWFTNQSIDAALGRVLTVNPDTTPWLASPALHRLVVSALVVAILGLVTWIAARMRHTPRGGDGDWLASTTALAATPLLVRVAWDYLVVLALPLFFVWAARLAAARATRSEVLLLSVAWMACAWPWPYFDAPFRAGPELALEAPRTLGLVLLLWLTATHVRRGAVSSV